MYSRIFRCVHEGFPGIAYRIGMHLIGSKNAGPLDAFKWGRGYQRIKTDHQDFDQHFHVRSEDERFVQALLMPAFKQLIRAYLVQIMKATPPELWR